MLGGDWLEEKRIPNVVFDPHIYPFIQAVDIIVFTTPPFERSTGFKMTKKAIATAEKNLERLGLVDHGGEAATIVNGLLYRLYLSNYLLNGELKLLLLLQHLADSSGGIVVNKYELGNRCGLSVTTVQLYLKRVSGFLGVFYKYKGDEIKIRINF